MLNEWLDVSKISEKRIIDSSIQFCFRDSNNIILYESYDNSSLDYQQNIKEI